MKSALAIQCLPQASATTQEIHRVVDQAIAVIAASGLPYMVGPMETVIEGPLDELFEVARKAHLAIIAAGSPTVSSYIKVVTAPELSSSEEKVQKYRTQGH